MTQKNTPIEHQELRRTTTRGARILENKCAVVFGAGGSIGAAVAKQIAAPGDEAQTTVVDALDDAGVNRYLDGVAKQAGKIDIVVDLTGPLATEYGNGKIAVELPGEEFMAPLEKIVRSHFITARTAARHMINQKSGVIIFVTGSPPGHTCQVRPP